MEAESQRIALARRKSLKTSSSHWEASLLDGAGTPVLRIRLATDTDLPQITATLRDPATLAALNDTAEGAQQTLRQTWTADPITSDLRHFVAETLNQGELLAYLRLAYPFPEPDCLWLNSFVVLPRWRRQGYGRQIIDLLTHAAEASGAVRTFGMHTVSPNTAAIALYQGAGFACVKREPWPGVDGNTIERLTLQRHFP